jgi:hypothetical protein
MDNKNSEPLDQMNILDQALDEYEKKTGLPTFLENNSHQDIEKYLSMSRDKMEKLTIQDCAEIAVVISSFSFHLQRCLNRENSRANWANNKLKEIVSGKEQQYRGSWDSQFNQAVQEDSFTRKLLKLKNYAQQRSDRLTFLSSAAKHLSEMYVNLQRSKVMK